MYNILQYFFIRNQCFIALLHLYYKIIYIILNKSICFFISSKKANLPHCNNTYFLKFIQGNQFVCILTLSLKMPLHMSYATEIIYQISHLPTVKMTRLCIFKIRFYRKKIQVTFTSQCYQLFSKIEAHSHYRRVITDIVTFHQAGNGHINPVPLDVRTRRLEVPR